MNRSQKPMRNQNKYKKISSQMGIRVKIINFITLQPKMLDHIVILL